MSCLLMNSARSPEKLGFAKVSGKANDEGLSAAARFLGKSPRTARTWTEHGVPYSEALFLRTLDMQISGLKRDRKRLIKQIEALENGQMRTREFGSAWRDTTDEWRKTLQERVAEIEYLLRNHPSGLHRRSATKSSRACALIPPLKGEGGSARSAEPGGVTLRPSANTPTRLASLVTLPASGEG
jgi:hypothetical protein